jgi:hypothetical protein
VSRPQEAVFKKLEESSQHLKSLYIRVHIDGKPIARMHIDGGAIVNLMPYCIFKKPGREDDKLVKTNLTLNDVGGKGNPMEAQGVITMELSIGSKSPPCSLSLRCKVTIVLFLAMIGFTPTTAFLLLCTNS